MHAGHHAVFSENISEASVIEDIAKGLHGGDGMVGTAAHTSEYTKNLKSLFHTVFNCQHKVGIVLLGRVGANICVVGFLTQRIKIP